MVFRGTSHTHNVQPFMCQDCWYESKQQAHQQYQQAYQQKQHIERKQTEERKAHLQALLRQVQARSGTGEAAIQLPDTEPSTEVEMAETQQCVVPDDNPLDIM